MESRKKTPINQKLEGHISLIYALYRAGYIQAHLEEAKKLVEHFFAFRYESIAIPRKQFARLQHLIEIIKTDTDSPLAQLIYAMFTARKGTKYIKAAHHEYENIHTTYPDYLLAYEKHLALCISNGEYQRGKLLEDKIRLLKEKIEKAIVLNVDVDSEEKSAPLAPLPSDSASVLTSTATVLSKIDLRATSIIPKADDAKPWNEFKSTMKDPVLPKKATTSTLFNPVVGSGRPTRLFPIVFSKSSSKENSEAILPVRQFSA